MSYQTLEETANALKKQYDGLVSERETTRDPAQRDILARRIIAVLTELMSVRGQQIRILANGDRDAQQ